MGKYDLLPGTENLPPEPYTGREFRHDAATGLKRGMVGLAHLVGAMDEMRSGRPNPLTSVHPDHDIMGPLPQLGVEPTRLQESDRPIGRVVQGASGVVPTMGLLAPFGMATGGMGMLGVETALGLLGATAGETVRESGGGGLSQFFADLAASSTPGLALKSAVAPFVKGAGKVAAAKTQAAKASKPGTWGAYEEWLEAKKVSPQSAAWKPPMGEELSIDDLLANQQWQKGKKAWQMTEQRRRENEVLLKRAQERKPMVATHSMNNASVLHADELGGLPAPSIGVVDPHDPGLMDDFQYGDITLVGGKDLVDPDTGTFVAPSDAYTVRYPKDYISMGELDDAQWEKLGALSDANLDPRLSGLGGLGPEYQDAAGARLRLYPGSHQLEDNLGAERAFMLSQGMEVPEFTPDLDLPGYQARMNAAMDKASFEDPATLTEPGFLDNYDNWRFDFVEAQGLKRKNMLTPNNSYGEPMPEDAVEATLDNVVDHMWRAPEDIPGSESEYNGMASEFGMPGLRAHVDAPFESWEAMDAARNRLTSRGEAGPDYRKMQKKYKTLVEQTTYKTKANKFVPTYDNEEDMIVEVAEYARTGNAGFLDEAQQAHANELIDMMTVAKTEYFEAKPMRGVKLEEFSAALTPTSTPKSVTDVLRKRGLKVKHYTSPEHKKKLLSMQDDIFFKYLLGLTGGGAAAGATHEMINEPRANSDGSISGLPLLKPF